MNFMFGKVAKKEEVKSVCVCVGGGGHPEPNSIFEEEKKRFFRDHRGPF